MIDNSEIEREIARLRALNLEIEATENLLDKVAAGLSEARHERMRLTDKIARLVLEDAVAFPSVVRE